MTIAELKRRVAAEVAKIELLEGRRMLDTLWRVSVSAGFASALCALALKLVGPHLGGGWASDALEVAGGLVLAVVSGYAAMRLLKVEELSTVASLVASLGRRLTGA